MWSLIFDILGSLLQFGRSEVVLAPQQSASRRIDEGGTFAWRGGFPAARTVVPRCARSGRTESRLTATGSLTGTCSGATPELPCRRFAHHPLCPFHKRARHSNLMNVVCLTPVTGSSPVVESSRSGAPATPPRLNLVRVRAGLESTCPGVTRCDTISLRRAHAAQFDVPSEPTRSAACQGIALSLDRPSGPSSDGASVLGACPPGHVPSRTSSVGNHRSSAHMVRHDDHAGRVQRDGPSLKSSTFPGAIVERTAPSATTSATL